MNDQKKKMVLDWMRKIHQLEYAHRYQSLHHSRVNSWLGISAFVITTLIAFSYRFPSVENEVYQKLPFFLRHDTFIPIASFIAAILTGLVTFLKTSEKSESHKVTSSNYEKLRHRIEVILTSQLTDVEADKKLKVIREEWGALEAINVDKGFFDKGKKTVKDLKKYPKELDFLDDVAE